MKTLLVTAVILCSFALCIVKCLPVDNSRPYYSFHNKTKHACSSYSEETISRQGTYCIFPPKRSRNDRQSCFINDVIRSHECYSILSDSALQSINCTERDVIDGIRVKCRCIYPSTPLYPPHYCNLTIHDNNAADILL